jgi:hypothetical protein
MGQDLLIAQASRLHSDAPQPVGIFWTSGLPEAGISTWQHSQEKDIHVPAGFEPAVLASEWSQTHALDCAATGFGQMLQYSSKMFSYITCTPLKIFKGTILCCMPSSA